MEMSSNVRWMQGFSLVCFVVVLFVGGLELDGLWGPFGAILWSHENPTKSVYSHSFSARNNHRISDIFPVLRPSQTAPFFQSCHPEVSFSNVAESTHYCSKIAIFVTNTCWSLCSSQGAAAAIFPFYILCPPNSWLLPRAWLETDLYLTALEELKNVQGKICAEPMIKPRK